MYSFNNILSLVDNFDFFLFTYSVDLDLFTTLISDNNSIPATNSTHAESLVDSYTLIDNSYSVFHTSVPNIKLYYPEPFIATPTFVHDDIWFLHIVIYQYWLWFGFIYMIIFFFLAFLITVRWCNVKHRPVRETRGVSRSKCGDLITATVPVSWAASIIIHESTDAIELSDGFGTSEMAVGIRAYQWGWEYYYPKDMDLRFQGTKALEFGRSSFSSLESNGSDTKSKFRNNLLTADILDVSNTPSSFLFGLDNSPILTRSSINVVPGLNKLISRTTTSLITSKKLLVNNNIVKSQNSTSINLITKYFFNNIWENEVTPRPNFTSPEFTFLSNRSLILLSSFYSNLEDVKSLIVTQDVKTSGTVLDTRSITQSTSLESLSSLYTNTAFTLTELKSGMLARSPFNDATTQIIDNLSHLQQYNDRSTRANFLKNFKLQRAFAAMNKFNSQLSVPSNLYGDQDFKRWSFFELLEDSVWTDYSAMCDLSSTTDNQELALTSTFDRLFNPLVLVNNFVTHIDFKDHVTSSWLKRTLSNNFLTAKLKLLVIDTSKPFLTIFKPHAVGISDVDVFNLFSNYSDGIDSFKSDLNLLRSQSSAHHLLQQIGGTAFNSSIYDLTGLFKNFSIYYQAFWKVFKSTIEEERTTFNFINYSNSISKLPFAMSKPDSILSSFQKAKTFTSFFDVSFYFNKSSTSALSAFEPNSVSTIDDFFTHQFPFMVGFESDIIRYTWFDWYSSRNLITAKAADTSVFGLNGVKQYEYNFSKDSKIELINKMDNYFTLFSSARRRYIPLQLYSPLFYNNHRTSSINSNIIPFNSNKSKLYNYTFLCNTLVTLDSNSISKQSDLNLDFSSQTSVNRNYYYSYKLSANTVDYYLLLADVMSKRSYLMHNYSNVKSSRFSPNYTNFIWSDIRDLINSNNQNTRFKSIQKQDSGSINLSSLKSQYVPLKKGIVNMIRIQADKAIAMPTDTRLQILAVSKDIIHSWSIPSAGIKIDCIPGYSSHRIAMFTVSGIYWGQCMEICGRFHHWMPIVVYFLKRDLFCLWCIHFISNNKQVNLLTQGYNLKTSDSKLAVYNNFKSWNYEL